MDGVKTPDGNLARLVVSAQMLRDLVVIGAVVRLIASATRGDMVGPTNEPDQIQREIRAAEACAQ